MSEKKKASARLAFPETGGLSVRGISTYGPSGGGGVWHKPSVPNGLW